MKRAFFEDERQSEGFGFLPFDGALKRASLDTVGFVGLDALCVHSERAVLRKFARRRSVRRPKSDTVRRPRPLSDGTASAAPCSARGPPVRLTPSRRCFRCSVPLPTRADRLLGEREDLRAGEARWCS